MDGELDGEPVVGRRQHKARPAGAAFGQGSQQRNSERGTLPGIRPCPDLVQQHQRFSVGLPSYTLQSQS